MATFPNEIHLKICAEACMDDGKTGRALSMVSRRIRNVSAEYRYRSIALTSTRQISRFLEVITVLPERQRRVRHLYMCDASRTPPLWFGENESDELLGTLGMKLDVISPDCSDVDPSLGACTPDAQELMQNILQIVKDSLETLFMSTASLTHNQAWSTSSSDDWPSPATCPRSRSPFSSISFPNLIELSIIGLLPVPLDQEFAPLLQRLHISGHEAVSDTFGRSPDDFHSLTYLPALTQLRISQVTLTEGLTEIIIDLLRVMGLRPACLRRPRDTLEILTPMSVASRCLLVELGPRPSSSDAEANTEYEDMLRALMVFRRDRSKFDVVQTYPRHGIESQAKKAKEEWLARINGEDRC